VALFVRGVKVEFDAAIAVMIVFANLSKIAVRSSCLICGADDEIGGGDVDVEGCDEECEAECDVEDELFGNDVD